MHFLQPGDQPVPGYRLVEYLGQGQFGDVWKASAPGGPFAALKFISLTGKKGVKEFRALHLIKRVQFPNLVPVTAFWLKDAEGQIMDDTIVESGELGAEPEPKDDRSETRRDSVDQNAKETVLLNDSGRARQLIIAMGLGEMSLYDRLEQCLEQGEEGIPPAELMGYMEDAARAIDYLNSPRHDLGGGPVAIQHCDIKPQNILIVGTAAQVCDFGLARVLDDVRSTTAAGSPAYAAPELFSESQPSSTTDQYSLAVSYIELRTGKLPFDSGASALEVIMAHNEGKLSLTTLPPTEQPVIRRALARRPEDRYECATEMMRELRLAIEGRAAASGYVLVERDQEIAPGYRLVECIERSDRQETWIAAAPGGKRVTVQVLDLLKADQPLDIEALRALQQLEHTHVTDIHAFWLINERGAIVPGDRAEGQDAARPAKIIIAHSRATKNLRDRLGECRDEEHDGIPLKELLGYLRDAAKGIDFLNLERPGADDRRSGIVHNNLRPETLLLFADCLRLGGFAKAQRLNGDYAKALAPGSLDDPYAAPELIDGQVTRHSDQWALSTLFVELLTGRVRFKDHQIGSTLTTSSQGAPIDLSELDPALAKIVARARSDRPQARFATCEEFVSALTAVSEPAKRPDEPIRSASPWRVRSLMIAPLAIIAAALFWYVRLPQGNVLLPAGCVPAEGAKTIDDHGVEYYDRILKKVGNHDVHFLLVTKTKPTDPETFYMMENKVWNELFAYFAQEQPEQVKRQDWQDGAQAPQRDPDVAEGVTTPSEVEGFVNFRAEDNPHFPAVGVAVEDAHHFAQWLGGRLPSVVEWDKAAGKNDSDGVGPYLAGWEAASDDQIAVNRGYKGPMNVGTAPMDIGPFGLRDMAGNGREWTRDLTGTGRVPLSNPSDRDMVFTRGRSHDNDRPLDYDDLEHGRAGVGQPEATLYLETEPTLGFRVVLDPEP